MPTGNSRFTEIIESNKSRGSLARVLGTRTVKCTISMATFPVIVVIRESRSKCPEMMTRAPICQRDSIHIVRVDVNNITSQSSESISGEVLVAPSLSTDLAVADAINRVCNTRTSWSCASSTQLGRCIDLSERGGAAGSWFSHVEVRHSHPPSPNVAVGGVHIAVDLSALH